MHSLKTPLPFALSGADFCREPWPVFDAMRAEGPIIPLKLQMIGRIWVTTSYEATEQVLKDNASFVLEGKNAGTKGVAGFRWWMPRSLKLLANNMLARDEPDHRRLRKLVDHAFGRHGIRDMRGDIANRADRLLDAFEGRDEIDLVAEYSRQLPLGVICDLLGLPDEDHATFSGWAESVAAISSVWGIFGFLPALRRMTRYIRGRIAVAEREGHPGLIGALVEAKEDGDTLSEDETVAMIFLLLIAGFETTTNLISGAVLDLETHPDQKAWLLADPETRMERAVEELARHVSSIQGTKPRFVARDVEVCGQALGQGDLIMALPAAANCDPAVFEEPRALRLDRFPNPHLVFSTGVHFCLGQQLARVETQVAIERLYARFPNLTLPQKDAPDYANRLGHRALKHLPLRPAGQA